MAIYFPPLFCGIGTKLKAFRNIEIEFNNGELMTVMAGEICIVDDIIGYGFTIKKETDNQVFRILNASMAKYFEIITKKEVNTDSANFDDKENNGTVIELQNDFEIVDVVKIAQGQRFLHFTDDSKNELFHDLYSIENKEKVLRMKDAEFEKYFKK